MREINTKEKIIFLLVFLLFLKFIFAFAKTLPLDMNLFLAWSSDLAKNGFIGFYDRWKESDPYPPFSLYLFWISGKIASFFPSLKFHEFLIKFWPILAEIFGGILIYQIAKRHKKEKLGILLAIGYCFNPAIIFNSSFWGQLDSLLATLLFCVLYFFEIKKPLFATVFFALSFFTKPQAIFFFPLFLFLLLKDFSFKKIVFAGLLFLFITFLLFFPFLRGKSFFWIISYHLQRFRQYPYATANAFNFWMLFGGQTVFDNSPFFGLSYALWGLILVSLFQIFAIFLVWKKRKEPFFLYFGAFFVYFISFLFGTRMHERYLIPALIFLTTSLIWEKKLWKALAGLSFCIFGNVYYIWWRVWQATLNDDPFFIWVPKNDKIGILISLATLFLFFYILLFIWEKIFGSPKILKINLPFPKSRQLFLKEKEVKKEDRERKESLFIFIILILSFLTHFLFIWHPKEVVFDEVHYGKAVNGYFKGEYFFTGHPPLGPQLIALGGFLGKYKPVFPFKDIGEKFANNSYISLRIMPALFGALLPLVIYFFLQTIGFPRKLAFLSSLFLIFENSLLVQSKFILIDSFWLFFGFLGLNFFFKSRQKNYNPIFLTLTGIFLGLALAVKWTSLSFFLFIGLFLAYDLIKEFLLKPLKSFSILLTKIFLGIAMASFLVYLLVFFLHFKLLPKSGPGDVYMSQEFLRGEKNFFEKFIELNKVSYETNIKAQLEHPYSSKFYTWPFLLRPIYYWNGEKEKIYLLGNPILWWLSTLAIFFLFFLAIFYEEIRKDNRAVLILLGYLISLAPYFQVTRSTFLYHYFPALIFSIFSLSYLLGRIKNGEKVLFFILILVFLCFLYFAPLSYGFPLEPEQYQMRIWLKSWI